MLGNLKIYLGAGLALAACLAFAWGLTQRTQRIVAVNALEQAREALVQRDAAMRAMQNQHDAWLLAAKEREERLQAEADRENTLVDELETVKRDDDSAADYGAGVVHPAYLDRLRRNAEGT